MTKLEELHRFWFSEIELTETYYQQRIPFWFFGIDRSLDEWSKNFLQTSHRPASTARERIANIIIADQLPRNAFREDGRAFEADPVALQLTFESLEAQDEARLTLPERIFLYMPLQHAEDFKHQDLSVEKFYELHSIAPKEIKPWTRLGLQKALEHQEVIRRFGRFPTRNKKMGRLSTPSEEKFLKNLSFH